MNMPAHLSRQISGQVPSQVGQQVSGPSQLTTLSSQMQSLGAHTHRMDPELLIQRRRTQDYIIQYLQRKNHNPNSEVMQKLSDVARRLEECIYKDTLLLGEDYSNISSTTIEQRLQGITKMFNFQHHGYMSSSAVSTMMPTPGMTSYGSKGPTVSQDNTMITTTGGGTMTPTSVSVGNMIHNAKGSVGRGQIASFNAFTGSIPNGYQQPPVNIVHNSGGNNIMSSMGMMRQSSQMIPTPGINNPHSISIGSESSSGGGFSSMDSSMVSQQQQKQYVGSQNSHLLQGLGMGVGLRSNTQHTPSPYNFHNMIGGMGGNTPAAKEGYPGPVTYGDSPKPLQQQLDNKQHQSLKPKPMSQQMLPLAGDCYVMNTSDLSMSGNIYSNGSTGISTVKNHNLNPSMGLKSKTNHGMLAHHTDYPSMQHTPQMKCQMIHSSQNVNFQSSYSAQEQLVQPQHQMQKFQHQQFQQSDQPTAELAQYTRYQQNQQSEQVISNMDNLIQSSIPSNLVGQLIPEDGFESTNESLLSQGNEQLCLSELQNQYHQDSASVNLSKGAKLLCQIQCSQDFQPSLTSQVSQQIGKPDQQVTESQNELSCLFVGSQADALPEEHWYSQSPQKSNIPDKLSFEQNTQEVFHQRLIGKDEAQQPETSSDANAFITCATMSQLPNRMSNGLVNSSRELDFFKQKRWLLLMLHSRKCPSPEGQCKEVNCTKVQQLWMHIDRCNSNNCVFPRCYWSKKLFNHHMTCKASDCPVCIPVSDFLLFFKAQHSMLSGAGLANKVDGSWKNAKSPGMDKVMSKGGSSPYETSDSQQSSSKRMKVQHSPSLMPKSETSPIYVPPVNQIHTPNEIQSNNYQQVNGALPCKPEVIELEMDTSLVAGHYRASESKLEVISNSKLDVLSNDVLPPAEVASVLFSPHEAEGHTKKEIQMQQTHKEICQAKMESNLEAIIPAIDPAAVSKFCKPKIKGVSLTELFTPEQIREHIISLRLWVGQSKAKAEKNQAMECLMSENSCQLCAVEKLTFEPPPIYCTPCGARLKRNAMYYTVGIGDTRHYFCIPCFNEARGDTIEAEGSTFPKSRLEKKKNDEETEEWWVQCDKCEAWQHQICALFNGRRNDGGQAEYTCPNCYIEEIEKGERKPLPQSAVLGAKDLPRTLLSDHIEQRLFRRLKLERQERARYLGKSFDEVLGAEALVVRVVSSVDKKLEVKQRFLEIFQDENYPTEFPYKSKVILLFQKIEGVEVCLFGMYVQEFGSECQFPNQRRVYLSYLDSVKYFRPEIKTVTGEALRTFVYHEILIGYLDFCKKRGFTSCYIWACPPLKGEDYILYCHPEIQKTPKSDKLREWYLSMLRKAAKETVVVGLTNLYDHFFITTGECKAKVTAARLPYFDGDYWPGAAEDMIDQLRQEENSRKQQKKGKTKKTLTKRALKAAGHTDLGCNASKDALLMQKLGETISPMKEDFIMVHLQHSCSHCCVLMVFGNRWVCNQCKIFQICDKCYDAEQKLDDRDRHPINIRERHDLYPIEITDVPSDTKDKDEIIESEFFDTRQAFLSLCQGNHYQYDTLRTAKHSSMMVLYHLHNPTAPAFVTTCRVCHHDIETGQGWRCEVCPDFDVCNSCYQRDGGIDHPHKLTNHPSNADRDAQSQEARQKRVLQLRKMLDLLVHASQCRFPHCQYPNCRKVKGLFRHGIHCKIRASGGCLLCKKMWYLLQLHARACKEPECHVPRCRDLKEHLKRLQQQSESRRRAAVNEMMRQRAAELQGTDT